MLLILLLIFSKRDEGSGLDWEKPALACLFGLVFIGFWVVITPYGSYGDDIYNMGHVRWLLDAGSIARGHQNLHYFDFPGMHLLVAVLSQVTHLGVFESRTLFLLFNAVIFTVILYLLFLKLIKNSHLAFLGMILTIIGSTMIVSDIATFYPRALGFTMLAGFLLLLSRSDTKLFGAEVFDRLILLILFTAMVISYFATSFLAPLILLGIYAVQIIGRDEQARASPRTIILLLSIVIEWEMYWTWYTFKSLVGFIPRMWQQIATGEFMASPLTLLSSNIGVALPLWANITRSLWWALLVFSTLLGLRNLSRLNKLNLAEKILTGGLLGVILLTVLGIFGTAGGYQFSRFLLYVPLFCIPILLLFLYQSSTWGRRGFIILTILVFSLALPTFLSSVNTICTDTIYPCEITTGKFLESHNNGKGESYRIYEISGGSSTAWVYYYTPNSSIMCVPEKDFYARREDEAWQRVDELIEEFQRPVHWWQGQRILIVTDKTKVAYEHYLGIPPDYPKWAALSNLLSNSGIIFNNGHIQIYIP
jgi:hypothetical protein